MPDAPTESTPVPAVTATRRLSRGALVIRGARVHNLKNLSLSIPRNRLVVITGVSGSGKSSLAFDTIYAEGQRRYVESLSAYARQFLARMDKPDVDSIEGISPAMAIEQKTTVRNPRSTVGTTTEIYDYLRLLYARVGRTICPNDGSIVRRDTPADVADAILALPDGTRLYLTFPLHEHPGHSIREELDALIARGFPRLLVRGEVVNLTETPELAPDVTKAEIAILVDRLIVRHDDPDLRARLIDSAETAFREGSGFVRLQPLPVDGGPMPEPIRLDEHFACSTCGVAYEEPQPRLFSFNSAFGACPVCHGFGDVIGIDPDLVIPDPMKSLAAEPVAPFRTPKHSKHQRDLLRGAGKRNIPLDVPYALLSPEHQHFVQTGGSGYAGIDGFFKEIESQNYKLHYRVLLARYRGYTRCRTCGGSRLRPEALYVKVDGRTLGQIVDLAITDALATIRGLTLSPFDRAVTGRILEELERRLGYLVDVGLGYLSLNRLSQTLSGGESQRINLATSLGSSLVGSLYVLDEPSIGLHPRDGERLIGILKRLRDLGNTVLVVEHDPDMMRAADQIIDMGPAAGEHGGEILFQGTYKEILTDEKSLTGQYLSGRTRIPVPTHRRTPGGATITVRGATEHNLKGIDVTIPLGLVCCVTGVSGSGKSTLVHDVLAAGLKKLKGQGEGKVGRHTALDGAERVDAVELVDQSPIGRTPRSNPATYLKIYDQIRDLYAATQMAKIRGYKAGFFSFNVPGGRCEACQGDGTVKIEMQFLADLFLPCESCKGSRYRQEVLDVLFRGKTIVEVLKMTAAEALDFFRDLPKLAARLQVLIDVGLGYVRLGQAATTLSGGEAQRMKLAVHLAAPTEAGQHVLYIFDEPTTGLHMADIARLLACFDALVRAGHSVLLIEHNLDVIKSADWLIELGPEGGAAGGHLIAEGTPEAIAERTDSATGRFLKDALAS